MAHQRDHYPKRTKTAATEEENIYIPTDIIHEEILCRLPSRDLLNCKRVCKDWLRLISSPRFIRKHLHRSRAGRNGTRILIPSPSEIIDYNYYASGANNTSKKIPYPPGFSGSQKTIILGSCDGLICLLDKERSKLAVFNPSTGKSDVRIVVGELDFDSIYCYWFGRHPSSGEYVLVIGKWLFNRSRPLIKVYKFSCEFKSPLSCSIEKAALGFLSCFGCLQRTGTLLHGILHWPGRCCFDPKASLSYIVSAYDLEKNEMLEISAPRNSTFTLGVVDGCLFAVFSPGERFELWMMREYGVEESWTKYRKIEEYFYCKRVLYTFGLFRNGDLILHADSGRLMKFNFNDEKATILKDHTPHNISEAVVCADSLVSPALIWGEHIE